MAKHRDSNERPEPTPQGGTLPEGEIFENSVGRPAHAGPAADPDQPTARGEALAAEFDASYDKHHHG